MNAGTAKDDSLSLLVCMPCWRECACNWSHNMNRTDISACSVTLKLPNIFFECLFCTVRMPTVKINSICCIFVSILSMSKACVHSNQVCALPSNIVSFLQNLCYVNASILLLFVSIADCKQSICDVSQAAI